MFGCSAGERQTWDFSKTDGSLRHRGTGLCIEAAGVSTTILGFFHAHLIGKSTTFENISGPSG